MDKALELKALYETDRLIALGWTNVQAFGMVGNDIQESLLIPAIVGDKGLADSAHGISQWRAGRFEQLKKYAAERSKPWEDLDIQIDFKDWELRNDEKRAGKAIAASTTIEEATAAAIGYHRPKGWTLAEPKKGHGWKNRLNNANEVAKAFDVRASIKVEAKPAAPAPITAAQLNETSKTIEDIQKALQKAGFNPGPIPGRQTLAAIKAFQEHNGLDVDGVVGPNTAKLLWPKETKPIIVPAPWMTLAVQKKGLHEVINKKVLMEFLKAGGTIGDPSVTPWCGDFVESCFAITLPKEILPGNPYLARNWLKFGQPLAVPTYGSVLVFWRGSKAGTQGHVGFYVSETSTHYNVLGGNQANSINESLVEKSRFLGARWPKTVALPTTGAIIKKASGTVSKNEA